MAKYTEKLVEKIVTLIEEDTYNISEICSMLRISRKTFYEWKAEKPEFAKAVEEAEARRDDDLIALARRSLKMKIAGYTVTEVKETFVPDEETEGELRLQKRVVTQKEQAPDLASIKLILERDEACRKEKNKGDSQRPRMKIYAKDEETKEVLERLRNKLQGKESC